MKPTSTTPNIFQQMFRAASVRYHAFRMRDLIEPDVRCSVGGFLLDNLQWALRYLVGEAGDLLDRRCVLISPISLGRADWATVREPREAFDLTAASMAKTVRWLVERTREAQRR